MASRGFYDHALGDWHDDIGIGNHRTIRARQSSKSIGYSLLATVFFVATATCISVLISMLAGATAGSGLVTGLIISIGLQFSTLRSKWRIYAETKESTSE